MRHQPRCKPHQQHAQNREPPAQFNLLGKPTGITSRQYPRRSAILSPRHTKSQPGAGHNTNGGIPCSSISTTYLPKKS